MATAAKDLPTRQSDNFGTILGNTFGLINASWAGLLLNIRTYAMLFLPLIFFIFMLVLIPLIALSAAGFSEGGNTTGLNIFTLVAGIVAVLGIFATTILLSLSITATTIASARGKVVTAKEVLNQSFPLFWSAVLLSVLTILTVILGFIALIIPGILAIFFLSFAIYVLVDKKLSPIDTMKESYELTKRNWKLVLSYFIVNMVIQLPSIVPILGDIISFALSIVYLVLPAILYVRMQQQNPVKPAPKK